MEPSDMGFTLPHEHLSADLGTLYVPPETVGAGEPGSEKLPWTMDNLGYIQQFP